jgi:hypothetical protein
MESKILYILAAHVRHFKTERSIKAIEARSPGLVTRLKDSLTLAPMKDGKLKSASMELGAIGITKGSDFSLYV